MSKRHNMANQIGDWADLRRGGERPSGDVSLFQLVCAVTTCAVIVAWIASLR